MEGIKSTNLGMIVFINKLVASVLFTLTIFRLPSSIFRILPFKLTITIVIFRKQLFWSRSQDFEPFTYIPTSSVTSFKHLIFVVSCYVFIILDHPSNWGGIDKSLFESKEMENFWKSSHLQFLCLLCHRRYHDRVKCELWANLR